ncbi:hypothetical protein L3X38_032699 [Prunus dulcis]|uniref:Uncharacterized protein n=1 Tax=Prunus dulcis TaxID=3755 RepID=A0AAD4VGV6_PRUDU|nr:hypothetical protein L3X38_032699 [Prunus dulcis]
MGYPPNFQEAFWELTGFGFVGTPKLSELEAGAIPGWVTPWEVAPPLRHSDLKEAFWELTGFGFVGTPKLSELEAGAIPGWVTTLGSCFVSSQKQNRAGCCPGTNPCGTLSSGPREDNILLDGIPPQLSGGLLGAHWLRVRRNSEVKRVGGWSNPRMGDPLGSCSVSSQKQILAGW